MRGDMRRAYQRFAPKSPGNTAQLTSARAQSTTNSDTTAPISMTTVPTANGSGAIGYHAASTSAFAFDSSVPVACRWCQASGSSRYRLVTARR